MKLFASALIFTTLAIFAAPYGYIKPARNIKITKQQIEHGRNFLLGCSYMAKAWPKEWSKLLTEKFTVVTPPFAEEGICARSVHAIGRFIVVYPVAESDACYGNIPVLLAHEMLHQVGLPPHGPDNIPDAIEVVIAVCSLERIFYAGR